MKQLAFLGNPFFLVNEFILQIKKSFLALTRKNVSGPLKNDFLKNRNFDPKNSYMPKSKLKI
jgi:hypothetical protein